MDSTTNRNHSKVLVITLLVIILVLVASLVGLEIGKSSKSTTTSSAKVPNANKTVGDVSSLVSYTLPQGWTQATCPSASNRQYIVPTNTSVDCSQNPALAITVFVDTANITDCSQLQQVQNVKNHVCKSLYIDGRKTLQSLTEYNQASTYKPNTSVATYFMNTGKGVVATEYTYTSGNQYQGGFDQLAKSLTVK
jgi:hypothetical protein